MNCNQCNRRVRDSFSDKLLHMMKYHPDQLLTWVHKLPAISYTIGEQLAMLLKGKPNASNETR